PIPWHFRIPPQKSPDELIALDLIDNKARPQPEGTLPFLTLQNIWLFRIRDTPTWSLYRLYQATLLLDGADLAYQSKYIFHDHPERRLKDIPDPKDKNRERQACLASLVETLVDSFNFKIKRGL
ncbi:hypothetical protein CPC08DRAFT_775066, partial [Agrocybe pediades]